jgi:hypothetical protein
LALAAAVFFTRAKLPLVNAIDNSKLRMLIRKLESRLRDP